MGIWWFLFFKSRNNARKFRLQHDGPCCICEALQDNLGWEEPQVCPHLCAGSTESHCTGSWIQFYLQASNKWGTTGVCLGTCPTPLPWKRQQHAHGKSADATKLRSQPTQLRTVLPFRGISADWGNGLMASLWYLGGTRGNSNEVSVSQQRAAALSGLVSIEAEPIKLGKWLTMLALTRAHLLSLLYQILGSQDVFISYHVFSAGEAEGTGLVQGEEKTSVRPRGSWQSTMRWLLLRNHRAWFFSVAVRSPSLRVSRLSWMKAWVTWYNLMASPASRGLDDSCGPFQLVFSCVL